MLTADLPNLIVEQKALASIHLKRYVIVDLYLPKNIQDPSSLSLLLINDGQNLDEMDLGSMLDRMMEAGELQPLLCAGIHAGKDRKNEYGTAGIPDYEGRGAKAALYEKFILEELIPFIHTEYGIRQFKQKAIAGFSLGGLSAIDTLWSNPGIFTAAGVFSGSLWWRTKSLNDNYNDDTDRIMHQRIKEGKFHQGLRFYFTTGSLDETADRNNNGIIDSIDDTLALIGELEKQGYQPGSDIQYLNFEDGRHDIPTWGRAMPGFLVWGWGKKDQL
ncbi:MAG TPA: alpha/beta hydrolase-fold protein [Flavisolibacter sp.]|nr:alpha/beta hydrolase-fold protein [Flavisolibacter sp.]